MTVEVSECNRCGKVTLTGEMACTKMRLCAKCASEVFGVPVKEVKKELRKRMNEQGRDLTKF